MSESANHFLKGFLFEMEKKAFEPISMGIGVGALAAAGALKAGRALKIPGFHRPAATTAAPAAAASEAAAAAPKGFGWKGLAGSAAVGALGATYLMKKKEERERGQ